MIGAGQGHAKRLGALVGTSWRCAWRLRRGGRAVVTALGCRFRDAQL